MSEATHSTEASNEKKQNWIKAVNELAKSIKEWAEEMKWLVDVHETDFNESAYGSYSLPELYIRAPKIQKLAVVPVGLDIMGAEGRVDIEAFPSLHRFILIRKKGQWKLMTDSMVPWPGAWGREAFLSMVEALREAA
jgi:hypothetical protein